LKKNYPETKTGQEDKETGREGDEETLRTAKNKGERIKEPCSWVVVVYEKRRDRDRRTTVIVARVQTKPCSYLVIVFVPVPND
jgi:hypothetical protein